MHFSTAPVMLAVAHCALLVTSTSALDNGLAITPSQGWRSWNYYGLDIDQAVRNRALRTPRYPRPPSPQLPP